MVLSINKRKKRDESNNPSCKRRKDQLQTPLAVSVRSQAGKSYSTESVLQAMAINQADANSYTTEAVVQAMVQTREASMSDNANTRGVDFTASYLKMALTTFNGNWKLVTTTLFSNGVSARYLLFDDVVKQSVNQDRRHAFTWILKRIHYGSISPEADFKTLVHHIDTLSEELSFTSADLKQSVMSTLLVLNRLKLPSELAQCIVGYAIVENLRFILEVFAGFKAAAAV